MSSGSLGGSTPAPAPAPAPAPSPRPPPQADHTAFIISALSDVIGQTTVAVRGANKTIASHGDVATAAASLFNRPAGTSLAAGFTKAVLDITYDRMTTTMAVGAATTAEATAVAFSAGLAGAEATAPSGPGAIVFGLATGAATYAYLNNTMVRGEMDRASSAAVSSVYNAYNGAMQRGAEAYRDMERTIYNLYNVPYNY